MYKRLFIIIITFAICFNGIAWAGDAATFVDLGFSSDGHYYTFAQYGVESITLKPWAEIFLVDVPKNNFVPNGKLTYTHTAPIIQGQDGTGALYTLLAANGPLFKKYSIDFLRQSRPLYLSMDSKAATSEKESTSGSAAGTSSGTPIGEQIQFRDFESGDSYTASLVSLVEGTGNDLKSSFFINLERTKSDNSKKKYVVGTPSIKRPLIASYRICRVMIAPKDGSMIFVIEMTKRTSSGLDIRYMVEALRL
ncbi:MAG: DUF2259 domain-containing protein [Treponema sp.]|nr:DUF2259 domain-containing protein [Treponema sp.]